VGGKERWKDNNTSDVFGVLGLPSPPPLSLRHLRYFLVIWDRDHPDAHFWVRFDLFLLVLFVTSFFAFFLFVIASLKYAKADF
jgi:hypothetical protein